MDISVIIPSYRPQEYIEECLRSLETQTLGKKQFEVLVILNGEKEPYYSTIQHLLDSYAFNGRLLYTDVAGVSNARNIGLDNAKGDYICFIDDDDYVSPRYLEELFGKAAPDTISLCYPYAFKDGSYRQISYSITEVYERRSPFCHQTFTSKVRRYFNGPWMKLIPMSFIQGRRFDPRFKNGEDSLFMFLISDKFRYVDFTSTNAVYYRRYRDNSAVTSAKSRKYRMRNGRLLISEYTKIFFASPFSYSPILYVSRVLATVRDIFV